EMHTENPNAVQLLSMVLPRGFNFHHDGSIQAPNGFELVSPPISGGDGEKTIREVCKHINDLKILSDHPSCGFHVHLSADEIKPANLSDSKPMLIVSNDNDLEYNLEKIRNGGDRIIDITGVSNELYDKYKSYVDTRVNNSTRYMGLDFPSVKHVYRTSVK